MNKDEYKADAPSFVKRGRPPSTVGWSSSVAYYGVMSSSLVVVVVRWPARQLNYGKRDDFINASCDTLTNYIILCACGVARAFAAAAASCPLG